MFSFVSNGNGFINHEDFLNHMTRQLGKATEKERWENLVHNTALPLISNEERKVWGKFHQEIFSIIYGIFTFIFYF